MKADNQHLKEQIIKYLKKDYTYKVILFMLKCKHGFTISMRTLTRLIKEIGIQRKNITESQPEEIVKAISLELDGSGFNLGYRGMWKRLRRKYGLTVKQKTVLLYLNLIDPEGIEARSRYKLKRRVYEAEGPNFTWHADNHDKLKRFGFPMYGCIDGYSRKMIWIKVSSTNNNPVIIANYYIEAVKKYGFLPTRIRTDLGTEATLMKDLQMALRHDHDDEYAGEKSFLTGKSTHNQRIESFWRLLRERMEDFYIDLFKIMEKNGEINVADPMDIQLLRYCFGPIILEDIKDTRKEWNEHTIRNQPGINVVGGIPNEMFNNPEKFGAKDCKKELDLESLEVLKESFVTTEPHLVNQEVVNVLDDILLENNLSRPVTKDESYNLYCKLRQVVNKLS